MSTDTRPTEPRLCPGCGRPVYYGIYCGQCPASQKLLKGRPGRAYRKRQNT